MQSTAEGYDEGLDEKNPQVCVGDVHSVDLLDEILASALLIDVGRILEEDEAESPFHVLVGEDAMRERKETHGKGTGGGLGLREFLFDM